MVRHLPDWVAEASKVDQILIRKKGFLHSSVGKIRFSYVAQQQETRSENSLLDSDFRQYLFYD
jgi:hypothetical protein